MTTMSQVDPIHSHLERIRAYLEEERNEEALEVANQVLETNESAIEVHQIRLTILLPELVQLHLIQATLSVLSGLDGTAYEAARKLIEQPLYQKLETLKKSIARGRTRTDVTDHLRHLDELAALGRFFPIIYFAQGVAYLEARKLKPQFASSTEGSSPLDILKNILSSDKSSLSQDIVLPVRDEQYTAWTSTAIEALRAALEHFDDSQAFVGEIYELLGGLYEEDEDLFTALDQYQKALERGRPVEPLLERLRTLLTQQVQQKMLVQIDELLNQNELEQAARLLEDYAPQPVTDEWRLRLAEIALLTGDIDQADRYYTHLVRKSDADTEGDEA